jgi:hypothetical protein
MIIVNKKLKNKFIQQRQWVYLKGKCNGDQGSKSIIK